LDSQVTFATHGADGQSLNDYLVVNTGARPATIERASYVLAGEPLDRLPVSAIHPGTLLEPDRGATLILACSVVTDDGDVASRGLDQNGTRGDAAVNVRETTVLSLQGRGIAGRRSLVVDGAVASVLRRLSEREDEYPLGVEVILADPDGRVVSLPRTTRWTMEVATWGT
jgi:alpha-D-ribose 1-methylphosphonate 5-triphosphate synthase subunit PhnH